MTVKILDQTQMKTKYLLFLHLHWYIDNKPTVHECLTKKVFCNLKTLHKYSVSYTWFICFLLFFS